MSSNSSPLPTISPGPVMEFQYRQMIALPIASLPQEDVAEADGSSGTEDSIRRQMEAERTAAIKETEQRLQGEFADQSRREKEKITEALAHFEQTRKDYFSRVEKEVVQLSLAIAAKILHRESQVEPLLVATLVRIAVEQLKEGTDVSVTVRPDEAAKWSAAFAAQIEKGAVKVSQDGSLLAGDCILETSLGCVNFSLDAQLKEVERGFLDILAQRPAFR